MSHDDTQDDGGEDKPRKKEKVLHTRVSETLDEELKSRASQLGVTVSNLVRNVLLNTFELVEDVVADSGNVGRAARGKSTDPQPIGWQELTLNINAVCDRCNAVLVAGARAGLAVYDPGVTGKRLVICTDCMTGPRGDS